MTSKTLVSNYEALVNMVSVVLPGQQLGPSSKYAPGPGTHVHNGQICASIAGQVSHLHEPASSSANINGSTPHTNTASDSLPTLSVFRGAVPSLTNSSAPFTAPRSAAAARGTSNILPTVDALVLARITRIAPRQATVAIQVVDDAVCADEFAGVIRAQDIRATEKDRVKVAESFRPGDVVKAQVISLGDQSNYYLSTARNELGVVMARSEAGNEMVPVSWREFRDVVTGVGESRKVAKPF